MADLESLQTEIGQWTDTTFPSHYINGTPNPRGPIYHLADPEKGEARELLTAFERGDDLAEEVADIVILCLAIGHLAGFSVQDAVVAKMTKNRARRWGLPDANGICEHIEEAN